VWQSLPWMPEPHRRERKSILYFSNGLPRIAE
jgi:hypothetical protein